MPVVSLLHAAVHRRAAAQLRRAMLRISPRRTRPELVLVERPDDRPTVALLAPVLTGGPQPDLAGVAVLDGDLVWSGPERRFDRERSTALPTGWEPALALEPRWVDLRWLPATSFARFDPRLTDAAAQLLAPLVGLSTEQLLRRERRRVRRVRTALAVLAVVVLTATAGAVATTRQAGQQRDRSVAQTAAALDQQWAATARLQVDSHPDTAFLLARLALRHNPALPEARAVALRAVQAVGPVDVLARPGPHRLTGMAVRDSDGLVVVGRSDGALVALAAGRPVRPIITDPGLHEQSVVAISAGRFLAVGRNGTFRLVEADLSSRPVPAPPGLGPVTASAWSDAQQQVVIGTVTGAVHGWDISRDRISWTVPVSASAVRAVAAASSVAAADEDGWVSLVRNGKVAERRPAAAADVPIDFAQPASSLLFLNGGDRLAVGSNDGRVRIFTTDPLRATTDLRRETIMPRTGPVVSLGQAGTTLLSTATDGNVRYWDSATAGHLGTSPSWGEPGALLHVGADRKSFYLAAPDGGVTRRRLDSDPAASLGAAFGPHTYVTSAERQGRVAVLDAVAAPDRFTLTLRRSDGEPASPRTLPITAALGRVSELAADGQTVFVQREAGVLTVWTESGMTRTPVPGGRKLLRLVVSPTGDRLIGMASGALVVWPLTGAQPGEPAVIEVRPSANVGVTFVNPTTVVVVTDDDRRIPVRVDLLTGRADPIDEALTGVSALAATADGRTVAVARPDGRLSLVDPATGRAGAVSDPLPSGVSALAFLDEGRTLAAGTNGGSIWLVDVATGAALVVLAGSGHQVMKLTPLADGSLLSSDAGAFSQRWTIGVESLLRRGCDLIGRPFTAQESLTFQVPPGTNPCSAGG
ncbi:WD40 repeat domain-containing protein [Actinoplanes sp. TRM 88003]|uniref:WD40 repeat domain-containing protein n=1 Tax=Paractinoplanes aksuensis TaxID=2939490 RepID=A0ABT1E3I3_9ACTN|nr:WD40 repeat domain-containing protein [Actinoplanes aksuensis]MCO8277698.1 WD40 repeat domain-containing protein [Actinoplanes aksuensis]